MLETDVLAGLNAQQREAVTTTEGPVLIVAGPGSGKTRVLTHRIAYLIGTRGVEPYNILAVTFTNKAAKEMRERLEKLVGRDADFVTARTFHAFCAMTLRRDGERIGIPRDFTIYDDADQLGTIKQALREANLDPKQYSPRSVLSTISAAKSNGIGPDEFGQVAESYFQQQVAKVFPLYQALLKRHEAVDFDDLLGETLRLLTDRPDVREKYQRRYRYIHVDEYQDTNHVQYRLVKELASEHGNLCVVGDPDQSIYGWRQADIRNILEFERDFPAAKTLLLEQNYRSTGRILDAAQSVISQNTGRIGKNLFTEAGPGPAITLRELYDEGQEAQFAVQEIQRLHQTGKYRPNECAIMYRMNNQSRTLEEACIRFGLPYQLIGGTRFYERKEVKDAIALMRLVSNPADGAAFERVIENTTLGKGIGKTSVASVQAWAREHNTSPLAACRALSEGMEPLPPVRGAAATKLAELARFVAGMRATMLDVDIVSFFDALMERSGYLKMLEQGGTEELDRVDNVRELRTVVSDYITIEPERALATFLEEAALVSDVDQYNRKADDREKATLITMHAAKGLEWPVVFIVGAEENILPHSRSQESLSDLEEERRLFFVGITRARERLLITHTFKRTVFGNEQYATRSRFVDSIPPDIMEEFGDSAGGRRAASGGNGSIKWGAGAGAGADTGRTTRWDRGPTSGGSGGNSRPASTFGSSSSSGSGASGGRTGFSPSPGDSSNANGRTGFGASSGFTPSYGASGSNGNGSRPKPTPTPGGESFTMGESVFHPKFGDGKVVAVRDTGDDQEVTIAFVGAGVKKLMAALARIERKA